MSDLISLIVPVYNTGKYLERCISSLVNQDYSNIEIIIVDDGSTDCFTLEKCDEIIKKYKNVILLHKPNRGSSSARNVGIQHSNGKYVGFIDSDDYIDKEMFSTLYKAIVKDNSKVAVAGLATHEGDKIIYNDINLQSGCYANMDLMHYFLLGHWHSACTNLYEKELFNDILFPENEVNEDYMLNYWIFKDLEKLSFCNIPFYHYIRRDGSNTSSPKSLKFLDWINHTSTILNELKNSKLTKEAEFQYLYSNIVLANSALLTISRTKSKEAEDLFKIVSINLSNSKQILFHNKFLSKSKYVMGIALAFVPKIYRFCILSILKFINKK